MRCLLITISVILIVGGTRLSAADSGDTVQYLDQGWSPKQRQDFYHTTQGSQLIPYTWVLALEQPTNEHLFLANDIIEQFRYLPDAKDPSSNPDGLPVGFTKDEDRCDKDKDRCSGVWLGLTCAACHTAQITYTKDNKETSIRIDGGPAMADLMGFLQFMVQSLEATWGQEDKFNRFAGRVIATDCQQGKAVLRGDIQTYTDLLKDAAGVGESSRNYTPGHGFARVDAFGLLTNEIVGTALGVPKNNQLPDAPVSYPFLWYTPRLDWVQWNGSVSLPIGRNVIEAMGVFGLYPFSRAVHLDPCHAENEPFDPAQAEHHIQSSVNGQNLAELEKTIEDLKAPPWPQGSLGDFEQDQVKRGEELYQHEKCGKCHTDLQPASTVTKVWKIPLQEIKTDEKMARNFARRCAREGEKSDWSRFINFAFDLLAPIKEAQKAMQAPLEEIRSDCSSQVDAGKEMKPASVLVAASGAQVLVWQAREHTFKFIKPLNSAHPKRGEKPGDVLIYKAGPLRGIWATAPLLHNGSAPNLYQLLLPAESPKCEGHPERCRVKKFCVGSRKFDATNVGFDTGDGDKCEGLFLFDTTVDGNHNTGHEYGTTLDEDQRRDLIEYLKTL